MNTFSDVIFVIRSVGERTEQVCYKLIKEQGVDSQNIVIVHENPFSLALKKSYETGINSKKRWLFCIDADVLLKSGSIKQILDYAIRQPKRTFEIQGYIFDKFFGCIRTGGVHLYRTEYLSLALNLLSKSEVTNRPEATTLTLMKQSGHPSAIVPLVVGLHAFEQDPFDIFRTMFVHSHKHTALIPALIDYWKDQSKNDSDFQIALRGLAAGLRYPLQITIDANLKIIHEAWAENSPSSKPPLDPYEYNSNTIDAIYANKKPQENKIDPLPFLNVKYGNLLTTLIFKISYILKKYGVKNGVKYMIARVLKKMSDLILKKIG